MDAPRNPTPAQIEDLKQCAELRDDEAKFGEARQDDEQMTINLTLNPESVKLIRIFKD